MAQYRSQVSYGLSQALLNGAPFPVQAKRAPTAGDIGYIPGTVWINLLTGLAYMLVGITANQATWSEISNGGGGAGAFSTLTSTGATTLATTGASNNTFGNTTGTTSVSITSGTGGSLVDSVSNGSVSLGTSLTTGTINIGGAAQTGTLSIGAGTAAQTISIGSGVSGLKTIDIGQAPAANVITINSITGAAATIIRSGTGGITFTAAGGGIVGSSTENSAQAIFLQANGGTSETIELRASQGTGSNSINLASVGGGITLQAPAAKGVTFSNGTQAPGIYVGTGSPNGSLSAAKGSLFMNVAGSGVADRLFVNSNGTTAWVAFTSAS